MAIEKAMAVQKQNYGELIEARFPGLIAKIKRTIEESEKAYEKKPGTEESYLWEHTTHVAALSHQLATMEKVDPLIPSVAALCHDAGKFAGGHYHGDDRVEEAESVRIAEPLLRESGMRSADVKRVLSGLKALYHEKAAKNAVADIVHDADFLSKFGALGVANFFVKSALRGRTLRSAVLEHLSKELTYAACLPLNMRTSAGRRLAAKKAADSLEFFRSLLAELRDAWIAGLKIRRIRIPHPEHHGRPVTVLYILPPACPECGGRWNTAWTIEKGIKCRKLRIDSVCRGCGGRLETSFCLPEIVS